MRTINALRCGFLVLITLLSNSLFAQEKRANIIGILDGSISKETLQYIFPDGAAIRLIHGKDSMYTVAYRNKFSFEKVPVGKIKITVSHLNFETFDTIFNLQKTMPLLIRLKEKVNTLKEITVKGSIPLIIRSGDTLKFNAAAVKLMEGDVALEILKKMPGVEISESGIKVYGKDIARTYVNDKMVFGKDDKMAALENIPAGEVVSINTYEEHQNPDAIYHSKREEKVRVLNIKTRNPIFGASTIQALVSEGHDFDKSGKNRYAAGISANIYSETLLVSLNALSNNNNRVSTRPDENMLMRASSSYTEKSTIDAKIDKTWGKFLMFENFRAEGGFSYYNSETNNRDINQKIYLPVPEYTNRESSDTNVNNISNTSKSIYLNLNLFNKKSLNILIRNSYDENYNDNNILRNGMSVLNENRINSKSSYNGTGTEYKFKNNLFLTYRNKTSELMVQSDFSQGIRNGEGLRIDSLASTGLVKVLESGPEGHFRIYDLYSNYSTYFKEEAFFNRFTASYQYHNEKSTTRKYVSDISNIDNIFTDSVKSYDYSMNHNYHILRLGSGISLSEKTNLNFGLSYKMVSLNREEQIPLERSYDRSQYALLPSISIDRKIDAINFINYGYSTESISPSVEQWRNFLNTQNPYQLSAGNQNLKQSYVQKLSFNAMLNGSKNRTILIMASADFTNNKIATKTTYFTQNTTLSDWGNYVAPAQSTLTTYENLDGKINISLRIALNRPIKTIKSTLSSSLSYTYDKDPSFIRDILIVSNSHSAQYALRLNSNFSKNLRINAGTSLRYTNSQNSLGQNSNYLMAGEQINLNIIFLKKFYINSLYDFSISKRYSAQNSTVSQNVINASIGFKFFKGSADLSISGYDLLNNTNGFQTLMTNDYISNKWTTSYGRFFTVNFAYKFYKSKKGIKMPSGMMNTDGGMLIFR